MGRCAAHTIHAARLTRRRAPHTCRDAEPPHDNNAERNLELRAGGLWCVQRCRNPTYSARCKVWLEPQPWPVLSPGSKEPRREAGPAAIGHPPWGSSTKQYCTTRFYITQLHDCVKYAHDVFQP